MAKAYQMMVTADYHDLNIFSSYAYLSRSSNTARTGTYSFLLNSGINAAYSAQLPFPALTSDFYFAFGMYPVNSYTNDIYIQFRQGSTVQFKFIVTTAGVLTLYDANNTLIASKTIAMNQRWYFIELHAVISNSGTMTVKVDNEIWYDSSTFDSLNSGTGVDNFYNYCASHFDSNIIYLDDIKLCTGGWPGVGGLYVLTPTSDGADNSWTASTGTDKFACVDEKPSSFTDYIYTDAGTLNTKQIFGHSGLQAATYDSIESVCVVSEAKLDVVGNGNIRNILKSSAAYGNGASTVLTTSEKYIHTFFDVNPDGGGAWDKTTVNAALPGVETI